MNKKGFYTDYIPDIISWAAYVLIFILFVILFTIRFSGCKNLGDTRSEHELIGKFEGSLNKNQILLSFLKTKVQINERDKTIAELIIISMQEDNFDVFESVFKETIGEYDSLANSKCSQITIIYQNKIIKTVTTESCKEKALNTGDIKKGNLGKVIIPRYYADSLDGVLVALVQGEEEDEE
ncbi:MAG: hypothetical protein MAG795_01011 [Candidatus Woesearchaeota archaeon]|nr:hypothetical protein [Candidatus Woesearchaeota archaeon]